MSDSVKKRPKLLVAVVAFVLGAVFPVCVLRWAGLIRFENKLDNTTLPTAIFTLNRPEVHANRVKVTGAILTREDIFRFDWDWGDGRVLSSFFPGVHHYYTRGEFTVKVTAYSTIGKYAQTRQVSIKDVAEPPTLLHRHTFIHRLKAPEGEDDWAERLKGTYNAGTRAISLIASANSPYELAQKEIIRAWMAKQETLVLVRLESEKSITSLSKFLTAEDLPYRRIIPEVSLEIGAKAKEILDRYPYRVIDIKRGRNRRSEALELAIRDKFTGIAMPVTNCDITFVRVLNDNGIIPMVYAVNESEPIRSLLQMGVSSFITELSHDSDDLSSLAAYDASRYFSGN